MAGQEPAVEGGAGALGDDVVLVARLGHGEVRRVLQGAADEALGAAEVLEQLVEVLVGVARARELAEAVEELAHRGEVLAGPLVGADPADRLGEVDDRVVGVRDGAVAGPPGGHEAQPEDALLGGLDEVGAGLPVALGRHGHAVAADLADRLGDAVEELGTGLHDVVRAEDSPSLLVGEEGEDDIAWGLGTAAGQVADVGQDHGVHVLHVHRASTPDAPVAQLGTERVDLPVGSIGGHDVEVAVDAQGRPVAVLALDAHEDARAARVALHDRRLEADLAQLGDDVLRRLPLPRPAAVAVVGAVDPDEVATDAHHLVDRTLHARRGVGGARVRAAGLAGGVVHAVQTRCVARLRDGPGPRRGPRRGPRGWPSGWRPRGCSGPGAGNEERAPRSWEPFRHDGVRRGT